MRYFILITIGLLISFTSSMAQFSASGGIGIPYKEEGTAVEGIYLFNTLSGATLTFKSTNSSIDFKKYDIDGTLTPIPASDITINPSGGETTYEIRNLEDSKGYFASDVNKAVWVIDYSLHSVTINSVTAPQFNAEGEGCSPFNISVDKTESKLQYRSPYGTSSGTLKRLFDVTWENLEWDSNTKQFSKKTVVKEKVTLYDSFEISPSPLQNTHFTVSGDQYARHFGMTQSATSEEYQAVAVEAYIFYADIKDGIENDTLKTGNPSDSESAPITRRFYAYANDPVASYYEWFIYKDGDETNWLARYQNEKDITYTFTEAGKYKVVLNVASENNVCSQSPAPIEFEISESSLEIPNFFSPGTSPGYNDEFKVKYKSLVKFKATIFNRWGNKIYEWTDPEQGWDGKYNGKYVSPGVYFYVIDATGSEGKRYKKGGDINIVRGK